MDQEQFANRPLRSTAYRPREPLSLHLEEKVTFRQGTLRKRHGGQRQSHVKQPEMSVERQIIGGMGWGGERRAWQAGSGLGGLAQLRRTEQYELHRAGPKLRKLSRAIARF